VFIVRPGPVLDLVIYDGYLPPHDVVSATQRWIDATGGA